MKKIAIGILLAFLLGAENLMAQRPQAQPETVVANLYKAAKTKSIGRMTKTELMKYFDEDLASSVWKAANSENGLDFDILYNAQDTKIRNFRILKGSPQTAAVSFWNVSFTNFGEKMSLTIELSSYRSKGWKISEIVYGDGSMLTAILDPEFNVTRRALIPINGGKKLRLKYFATVGFAEAN